MRELMAFDTVRPDFMRQLGFIEGAEIDRPKKFGRVGEDKNAAAAERRGLVHQALHQPPAQSPALVRPGDRERADFRQVLPAEVQSADPGGFGAAGG